MKFDDFAKLCRDDVEKYRDLFFTMHDMNGTVFSETVGFHISLDEPEDDIFVTEMINLFQPTAIWAGNEWMLKRLNDLGHQATLFSWFGDGGFIVVSKIPLKYGDKNENI